MSADQTNAVMEERHAQFLRLFLSSERELFRTVAVLVPAIEDAEEIVQQTAIALWEKFDLYDPQRPFTPFACGFATNVARQWIASRRRWNSVLERNLADELLRRRDQLRPLMDARLRNLDDCLQKLPDDQRRILDRFYFRRTPIDAIAAEVGRSIDAVYKSLQRIRHALRDCIERASHEDPAQT